MTTFNDQARTQWDNKAEFWDNLHGDEGNLFHRHLVGPAAEKLLNIQKGEKVADIGCGNGNFSRRLAQLGAEVIASDFSAELIERARARSQTLPITYHVVDATDESALLSLGAGQFDAAVCNMAIMDIADIHPLFRTVRQLLKPDGRFVFTLQHPCFNNEAMMMVAEQVPQNGAIYEILSVKLTDYLHIGARLSAGAPGEPNAHYVFHRTLTELLTTAFRAGFVMDGIEEMAFGEEMKSNKLLSWVNYTHIPAVFAARLRV